MKLRLLIADDNAIQIESILTYVNWEELGITEIKTSKDGEECYEIAKSFKPHIVILDIEMPRCDGMELAQRLRRLDKKVKLIFITCHEKFEYAKKAIEFGASAYILKPISYRELKEVAKNVTFELKREMQSVEWEKEYLKKQQQIDYEIVDENDKIEKLDIFEIKDEILDLIEKRKEEEIISFFKEKYFFEISEKSFSYAKYICYSILNALHLAAKSKNVNIEDLFDSSVIVWDKLATFNNSEEIVNWLLNLSFMIIKHIKQLEENVHQKLVYDIKTMIDQSLYTIESVEQIARTLKVSSSYAKNTFKKYMGITIFDYLFEKRMQEAKNMLEYTDMRIYEIAEKLGYKSKAYFSSAFQKYTGITPNEYRKQRVQK